MPLALPPAGPPPVLSRQGALPFEELLKSAMGVQMGTRASVVEQCAALSRSRPDEQTVSTKGSETGSGAAPAVWGVSIDVGSGTAGESAALEGEAAVRVVQCSEGGAVTRWANGACLYVNAGRYRNGPSARYRNRFWREQEGLRSSHEMHASL